MENRKVQVNALNVGDDQYGTFNINNKKPKTTIYIYVCIY